MNAWLRVLVLSVGGALGVNARYWLGVAMSRWTSPQFPWATFTINVSGSFAIGFLTTVLTRWLPHPHLRLLVIVGFLGGYTTFSSYEFEGLTLWERGETGRALAYLVGSVLAGFAAVVLGVALARAWTVPPEERRLPAAAGFRGCTAGGPAMIPAEAQLLRIAVNASRRLRGEPLYRAIVARARALGLAGASVFPVEAGFGAHHRIHDAASDNAFADLPVVIEIVEAPERLASFLAELRAMTAEGLVTVESVRVVLQRPATAAPS